MKKININIKDKPIMPTDGCFWRPTEVTATYCCTLVSIGQGVETLL